MQRIGKLEFIAFVVGFSLLAYELVAARVLAPSIGSSVYVWTSVIGVIIAALSLGFWLGGKLADKRALETDIAWLLLLTSFAVVATKLFYASILQIILVFDFDVRVLAVVAATVLFAPASLCIGLISPYLAKLNIRSLKVSGSKIASLSAFDSIGGIAGTFLTGFFLIGWIGSHETFGIVAVVLVATSWLVKPRYRTTNRIWLSAGVLFLALLPQFSVNNAIAIIDTPSAHYEVRTLQYKDRLVTGLVTGPSGVQSSIYNDDSTELVFWYNKQIAALVEAQKPKRILVLGGGAFTLPEYLGNTLPDSQIDVVEIDPELEDISEKYFDFTHPKNVRLIFDDARRYLEKADTQYDAVLVDVYGDSEIPFNMMTKEYAVALERVVATEGVAIINLIAGSSGACRDIFIAAHSAYASQFEHRYTINEAGVTARRVNNVLLYSRQPQAVEAPMRSITLPVEEPFNDNAAPVEDLYYRCTSEA